MLKTILNLKGAQQLSKNDQQTISGGIAYARPYIGSACRAKCASNCESIGGVCFPCSTDFGSGFECRIY